MPLQRSSTGLGFLWYSIQIHRFGFLLVRVIFFVSWGLKAIDPQVLFSCDLLDPDPLVWVSISPCDHCSRFGFPLIQSAVSIYMFGFPLIQSAGLIRSTCLGFLWSSQQVWSTDSVFLWSSQQFRSTGSGFLWSSLYFLFLRLTP